MRADSAPMSVRPWTFGFSTPMTLPMSFIEDAPDAAIASLIMAVKFGIADLGGQVGGEDGDLGGFLRHQVRAVAGLELGDGFLALLDHLVDDREHLGVVELDALVDLALLDAGLEHADAGEAVFLARPHRRLHVFGDAGLEAHPADQRAALRLPPSREARLRCRLIAAAFLRFRSWVGFS